MRSSTQHITTLAGFILAFCLIQTQAGRKCKGGKVLVSLNSNPELFDLHNRPNSDVAQLQKVIKGVKGKLKLTALDVFAVDADSEPFQVKRLCVQLSGATDVTFQYFAGADLQTQVGEDDFQEITSSNKFTKVCSKPPKSMIGGIIMLVSDNSDALEHPNAKTIRAKNLDLRACMYL